MKATDWLSATVFVMSLGVASLVGAQPGILVELESLDRDGDGAVTAAEFEAGALQRWAEDDLDSDGKVTVDEVESRFVTLRQQRFAQQDENGDGVLDPDELSTLSEQLFSSLDRDGSGDLTQAELNGASPMLSVMGPRFREHAGLPGDTNRDGAISKEEAVAAARMLLRHLDTNGDGVVGADELAQRRQLHGTGPIL